MESAVFYFKVSSGHLIGGTKKTPRQSAPGYPEKSSRPPECRAGLPTTQPRHLFQHR